MAPLETLGGIRWGHGHFTNDGCGLLTGSPLCVVTECPFDQSGKVRNAYEGMA